MSDRLALAVEELVAAIRAELDADLASWIFANCDAVHVGLLLLHGRRWHRILKRPTHSFLSVDYAAGPSV